MSGGHSSGARALAPRERVWIALSELFRDTELQPFDFDHIAATLREAGLDGAAAERVLLEEVAPAFGVNLFATAGNWQGWPDAVVVREVKSRLDQAAKASTAMRLARGLGWRALRGVAYRRLLREDWARVLERMSA